MKRYHYNATNEPITFRTWILNSDYVIGEDDFKWLKAFDIPIRIESDNQSFDTHQGTYHYTGRRTITLDTTTDKQRNMLTLKYGSNVVLIQEEYMMPNSMSACVLDRIVW